MKGSKRQQGSDAIEFETAFGYIWARATERGVSEVGFGRLPHHEGGMGPGSPILQRLAIELKEYFAGRRRSFGVPLDLGGLSDFRRAALRECAAIPYGETAAYSDLSRAIGSPKAARAVGQAMARNPLPILIPCHRVIGSDGSLTGFGGDLGLKKRLLELERAGSE